MECGCGIVTCWLICLFLYSHSKFFQAIYENYGYSLKALWVVWESIRERNYRLNNKNYLSGPIDDTTGLRALGYTWVNVAELLQVSRSTLYRRLKDYGVSSDDCSDISSPELDEVKRKLDEEVLYWTAGCWIDLCAAK